MRFRQLKKQSQKYTPQKEQIVQSAHYIRRIKALIVDLFMIYMPIMYIMTYVVLDGKDDLASSNIAPFVATILYGIIYAIFLSKTGQTPGKKAYEIKVISSTNLNNLSFSRSFLRFLAFLFTVTTVFGLFLPFFRTDKKMLHDLIIGSKIEAY